MMFFNCKIKMKAMMGFERPDHIIFFFSVLGDRNFCTENGSYYIYKRVDFVGSRNCC